MKLSTLAAGGLLTLLLGLTSTATAQTVSRTNINSSVTLAWDQSPDPTVAKYNVYYGVASGVYTNITPVSPVTNTTVTFTPMVRGTKYYFAATCVNTNGLESLYSTEISWTSPSLPTAPTNPKVLSSQ